MAISRSVRTTIAYGSTTFSSASQVEVGDKEIQINETLAIAASPVFPVNVAFLKIKAMVATASVAGVTIMSGGDSVLAATDQVFLWNSASGKPNPFTSDLTSLAVNNLSGESVDIQIWILTDEVV